MKDKKIYIPKIWHKLIDIHISGDRAKMSRETTTLYIPSEERGEKLDGGIFFTYSLKKEEMIRVSHINLKHS